MLAVCQSIILDRSVIMSLEENRDRTVSDVSLLFQELLEHGASGCRLPASSTFEVWENPWVADMQKLKPGELLLCLTNIHIDIKKPWRAWR